MRGLLSQEHKLTIWQHADNNGWGAAIHTWREHPYAEAHGYTLSESLEALGNEVLNRKKKPEKAGK